MKYDTVFEGFQPMMDFLRKTEKDILRVAPYSDYGKAVFGFRTFPAGSPLGILSPADEAYAPALEAAMPDSSLLVWMKFGAELRETRSMVESLAALNAISGPMIRYREAGVPAAVDYSEAEAGASRTYTIPLEAYKRTDVSLTTDAMTRYRGLSWHFLIGEVQPLPSFTP